MKRIRDQAAYATAYYRKNRVRLRDAQKQWRGSIAGRRHKFGRLLKRIGITAFDWAKAWKDQSGRCAGCLSQLDDGQNTHMDHCHSTGVFRGLLCSACNLALGKVGDDSETLRRLATYLEAVRG